MEPLPAEMETYEGLKPLKREVQLLPAATLPRAAYRNKQAGELVQVQNNRFGFNWIKTSEDHKYPHSEATLDRFFELFARFSAFVEARQIGKIAILQCELTNVNVVLVSDVGENMADMKTVFKLPQLGEDFPNVELENQMVGSKHLIKDDEGKPIGRVHSVGQPALKVPNNEEAYRFDISARGAPLGRGTEGAEKFFEAACSAVNAVFLASTTNAGHRFWGRQNG